MSDGQQPDALSLPTPMRRPLAEMPTIPRLTVIVPTRNEAENVEPLLRRLATTAVALPLEVLFVDDSTDHTPNMIRQIGARLPFPVRLVERPLARRNGLSGAVVEGMQQARGEWLCVMDADLQHPPELIPDLLAQAQKTGAQLVVGSRKADFIGPLGLSPWRSLTSQLLTILARMIFPRQLKNVSDPLTGLFLVQRAVVDTRLLRPDGFKILLELLIRLPNIHASELLFDFGQRTEGQSKADLHEGLRFLRHLLRLRLTAKPHFARFWLVGASGLLGNIAILVALTQWLGLHYLLSAVVATEGTTLWNFYWTENWVFRDRREGLAKQRLGCFLAMNQLFLLLVLLPMMALLVAGWGLHYVTANLLAIGLVSLIRYALSEQWIWTKGLIAWPRPTFWYDLHHLMGISSMVRLPELDYFATAVPPTHIDIHLRLDRHGTPRCLPGAICYDEGLGRLGFGVAIMQGQTFSEVVVSPMLEKSPHVLYQSVVEPLLRWTLVRKGYALVPGACLSLAGKATLISAPAEVNATACVLWAMAQNLEAPNPGIQENNHFMAGDVTILGGDGCVWSFPKPLLLNRAMLGAVDRVPVQPLYQRLALWLRQMVPGWNGRWAAGWLSRLNLPVATLNAYWQRWLPPPTCMANELVPALAYGTKALLKTVVLMTHGHEEDELIGPRRAAQTLADPVAKLTAVPPLPTLTSQLSMWQGEDLAAVERQIMVAGLQNCTIKRIGCGDGRWRQPLPPFIEKSLENLER